MARQRTRSDSKNWYGMLGYLVATVAGLGYAGVLYSESGALAAGTTLGFVFIGLTVYGFLTYPMLFRDSMHLSRAGHRWTPKWYSYVAAGLGIPIAVYLIGNSIGAGLDALTAAIFVFAISTIVVNAVYLYRRHKFIGRP